MILLILIALTAVCGAGRINQNFPSPISASTSGALLGLLHGSTQDLSTGSYRKEVQGMVMDAVNRRTRRSRQEPSGPKGPRTGWPTFTQFRSTETHFGDKPLTIQSTVVSSKAKSQSQSSYGQKLVSSSPTTTQLGYSGSRLAESQTSQIGKKPIRTIQIGEGSELTLLGSTGFRFVQNAQSIQGSRTVSTTIKPAYGQKHFDSTYQHDHYRSVGPQFSLKPQTDQGSSSTFYTASSPIFTLRNKPVNTTQTSVTTQHPQFRSSGTKFGQISQPTLGAGSTKSSFGQKPTGSSYQQTQSGSAGFKFGQNSQSTLSAGSVSTTAKPCRIADNSDICTCASGYFICSFTGHGTSGLLAQFPPAGYRQSVKPSGRGFGQSGFGTFGLLAQFPPARYQSYQSAINRPMPRINRLRNNRRPTTDALTIDAVTTNVVRSKFEQNT